MNIYLLRHPKPDYPAGVCYGKTDMPATQDDHTRVLHAIHSQYEDKVNAIYSSPLQRCRNLAKGLADVMSKRLDITENLQEMDFGDWEGQAWGDIERTQIIDWQKDILNFTPPNGEPVLALVDRCQKFLSMLVDLPVQTDILAVTHAGIIRSALHIAGEVTLDSGQSVELDYGGVTHLTYTGNQFHVKSINVT